MFPHNDKGVITVVGRLLASGGEGGMVHMYVCELNLNLSTAIVAVVKLP